MENIPPDPHTKTHGKIPKYTIIKPSRNPDIKLRSQLRELPEGSIGHA